MPNRREGPPGPYVAADVSKPAPFLFWPQDWLASRRVAALSPAGEGAFIRLLCYQAEDPEGVIENDEDEIRKLSRLSRPQWKKEGAKILALFSPVEGGRANAKLEQVLGNRTGYRARQAEHGRRGAARRWGRDDGAPQDRPNGVPHGVGMASESESESDPDQTPPSASPTRAPRRRRRKKGDPEMLHSVPDSEDLTPARSAKAAELGVADPAWEWHKFKATEFGRGFRDVSKRWGKWCASAVENHGAGVAGDAPGGDPRTGSPGVGVVPHALVPLCELVAGGGSRLRTDFNPWRMVSATLKKSINAGAFDTWFKPTTLGAIDGDSRPARVVVLVPNQLFVDWLSTHHGPAVRKAVAATPGLDALGDFEIVFLDREVFEAFNKSLR